jgi:2-hydroxycyclohexanecarboxyl-CoA dehydrogenase
MKLRGKTALVTGGGRGIGRAIALGLAGEGAQVAVLDIVAVNAQAVSADIDALGVKGLALCADLTHRDEVERAVAETLAQFGQLDILVNNAGWDKLEPFLDSEEETWDRIIAINWKAVLYVCKAVDVAGAVLYLASPAADYVTGQTLSVSGGLTMA